MGPVVFRLAIGLLTIWLCLPLTRETWGMQNVSPHRPEFIRKPELKAQTAPKSSPFQEKWLVPIPLNGKNGRMMRTSQGYTGYLDVDEDNVDEWVLIKVAFQGVYVRGTYGKQRLETFYDHDLKARQTLLHDGDGGQMVLDFDEGAVRLQSVGTVDAGTVLLVTHTEKLAVLDSEMRALLAKYEIVVPQGWQVEAALPKTRGVDQLQASADNDDFEDMRKACAQLRIHMQALIDAIGLEAYQDYRQLLRRYQDYAIKTSGYVRKIIRYFNPD